MDGGSMSPRRLDVGKTILLSASELERFRPLRQLTRVAETQRTGVIFAPLGCASVNGQDYP